MNYITFGKPENEAIVFLHGWGGGFSSFMQMAKSLSSNYFSVIVDFNDVFYGSREVCVIDFALALNDVLKNFKHKSFNFVAHSFGGRVLAKFARNYPEKIKKIVLFDTAGLPTRFNLWYYLKVKRRNFVKFLVKHGFLSENSLEKFASADYKRLTSSERKSFSNIVCEDLTNCYAQINAKTFIYWGKKDKETPLYMAKKLNKIIKNSGLYVDKNAGHFSYLENSTKATNAVKYFLEN
ncbi:MAG: alpha/beta fold hydrolase [Clostridia bacterium]|nr:alpha/beta fold hydrolase [Clostridia bacterium]